jgi:hypothetical protein
LPALHIDPAAYLRHAPSPLHVPSSPHDETSAVGQMVGVRGGAPLGTNEHVPGAAAVSQALQVSAHGVLQQTPSMQNPLTQSPPHPHACPLAFFMPPVPLHATSAGTSAPASGAAPPLALPHAVAPTLMPSATTTTHDLSKRALSPNMLS